jgi:hypothetical protein
LLFFDFSEILKQRFGDSPENYYWNGDMHFNFDGIKVYGEVLGNYLYDYFLDNEFLLHTNNMSDGT